MITISGRPAHLMTTDEMFESQLDRVGEDSAYSQGNMMADMFFIPTRFPFSKQVKAQLAADILEDYEDYEE